MAAGRAAGSTAGPSASQPSIFLSETQCAASGATSRPKEQATDPPEKILHHGRIAADGDTLIEGIEIVVVKGKSYRKPFDDVRRKLCAGSSPLFFSIVFDEDVVDVSSDQTDSLFLEVAGIGDPCLFALLFDDLHCLLRSRDVPHGVKGVHIERQVVERTLVVGYRTVGIAIEGRKTRNVIPNLFVVGVKDMGSVNMDVDILDLLGVDVSGDMRTSLDHQHFFAFIKIRI